MADCSSKTKHLKIMFNVREIKGLALLLILLLSACGHNDDDDVVVDPPTAEALHAGLIVAVKAEEKTLVDSLLTSNPELVDLTIPATATADAGLAALHVAAKYNVAVDVVDALIDKGASVDLAGPDDNTALIYAARDNDGAGTADIVTSLLPKDVKNVDAKETVKGRSALHWAAAKSTKAVVDALIAKGASLTLKDTAGDTPWEIAKGRDTEDTEVSAALAPEYSEALITALGTGTAADATAVTAELEENPNSVNGVIPSDATKDAGLTALHVAVRDHATSDVVTALVAGGADVNALTGDKSTPLILAAKKSSASGVFANILAFLDALLGGESLPVNADVELKDNVEGRTALHWAAAGDKDVASVRKLVTAGSSLTLKDGVDGDGYTALGLAKKHRPADAAGVTATADVLAALTPAEAEYSAELIAAVRLGTTATTPAEHVTAAEAVTALLEKNPNLVDGVIPSAEAEDAGLAALHVAAKYNVADNVVKALLDAGADETLLDGGSTGNTALELAKGRTADEAGRDVIVTALEPATSPADTN